MSNRFVITMTAANRVGILAATTTAIADLGGDIVEVRQTLLQGFFTMIIAADFPPNRDADLVHQHIETACERYGVALTIKDPEVEAVQENDEETENFLLEIRGADTPGVVRSLSAHMARLGIDITDLHTRRRGEGRFRAALQVAVPVSLTRDALHGELQELASRTGLEITLGEDVGPADSGVGLEVPALSGEMSVVRDIDSKPR